MVDFYFTSCELNKVQMYPCTIYYIVLYTGSDAAARIIKLIFSKPVLTDKIHRTVMYYLRALSFCAWQCFFSFCQQNTGHHHTHIALLFLGMLQRCDTTYEHLTWIDRRVLFSGQYVFRFHDKCAPLLINWKDWTRINSHIV